MIKREDTRQIDRRLHRVRFLMFAAIVIAAVVVAWTSIVILNGMTHPAHVGLVDGKLAPCPNSPNAVGSGCDDAEHKIAPFSFNDPENIAWEKLQRILEEFPTTSIVTVDGNYLHALSRSKWLRFADDMEFLIEPDTKTIHLRSASRVGYSDFGVNRERIEKIRSRFQSSATDGGNFSSEND